MINLDLNQAIPLEVVPSIPVGTLADVLQEASTYYCEHQYRRCPRCHSEFSLRCFQPDPVLAQDTSGVQVWIVTIDVYCDNVLQCKYKDLKSFYRKLPQEADKPLTLSR